VKDLFSYSSLDADASAILHRCAVGIRRRLKRTAADMIETGRDLVKARQAVKLAIFAEWCESECGISVRLAQLFIRSAEVFGDRCEIISQTSPTNLMKLAALSVPEDVRERLVERIAAGEKLKTSTIAAEVRSARQKVEKPETEWDTATEVKAAMRAARRKATKPIQPNEDDELVLSDFFAAWGVLPERLRLGALREIGAETYIMAMMEGPR